jgi:muconolactone delta-isomerase
MNQYLVDFDLPLEFTPEFVALIPEQRRQIDELMAGGVVLAYALSNDRSKVWATISADSEEDLMQILHSMPLIQYMDPTVYELAFFNSAGNGLPAISLN